MPSGHSKTRSIDRDSGLHGFCFELISCIWRLRNLNYPAFCSAGGSAPGKAKAAVPGLIFDFTSPFSKQYGDQQAEPAFDETVNSRKKASGRPSNPRFVWKQGLPFSSALLNQVLETAMKFELVPAASINEELEN